MIDGVECSSQVEQAQGRNKSTVSRHEKIIVDFKDSRLSAVVLTVRRLLTWHQLVAVEKGL